MIVDLCLVRMGSMVDGEDELCDSRVGTWHAVVYRCLERAARAERARVGDAPACDEEEGRVFGQGRVNL
jgi:hypothetical protein